MEHQTGGNGIFVKVAVLHNTVILISNEEELLIMNDKLTTALKIS